MTKKKCQVPAESSLAAGHQCLLLLLADGRRFLTEETNLPLLIEFARTFQAELHQVELREDSAVHTLDALVAQICSGTQATGLAEYTTLAVKVKQDAPGPIIDHKTEVAAHGRNALVQRGSCAVHELQSLFLGVDKTVLSNILNRTVQKLRREGYSIAREKTGCYRVVEQEVLAS